jgi:hypothetical protein
VSLAIGQKAETVWLMPSFRAQAAQERINDLDAQLSAELERRARAVREAIDCDGRPRQGPGGGEGDRLPHPRVRSLTLLRTAEGPIGLCGAT